jgi:hypothetical protein
MSGCHAGVVYPRLPGLPQACRQDHPAGGDDAEQRLSLLQSRTQGSRRPPKTLPPQPTRVSGHFPKEQQTLFCKRNRNRATFALASVRCNRDVFKTTLISLRCSRLTWSHGVVICGRLPAEMPRVPKYYEGGLPATQNCQMTLGF